MLTRKIGYAITFSMLLSSLFVLAGCSGGVSAPTATTSHVEKAQHEAESIIEDFFTLWLDQWKFEDGTMKMVPSYRNGTVPLGDVLAFVDPASSLSESFQSDSLISGRLGLGVALNVQDVKVYDEADMYRVDVSYFAAQNDVQQAEYDKMLKQGPKHLIYEVSVSDRGLVESVDLVPENSQAKTAEVSVSSSVTDDKAWTGFLYSEYYLSYGPLTDAQLYGYDPATVEYALFDIDQDGRSEAIIQMEAIGDSTRHCAVVFAYDNAQIYLVAVKADLAGDSVEDLLRYSGHLAYDRYNKTLALSPSKPDDQSAAIDIFSFGGDILSFDYQLLRQKSEGGQYAKFTIRFSSGSVGDLREAEYDDHVSQLEDIPFCTA